MSMPVPPSPVGLSLLRAIWDLAAENLRWPVFVELDKRLDRVGIQADTVLPELPAGLVYGIHPGDRVVPRNDQSLGLTVAGGAGCSGAEVTLSLFLDFIRLAVKTEEEWIPTTDDPSKLPTLTDLDLARLSGFAQLSDSDQARQTRLVPLYLQSENWGWSGFGTGDQGHWQVTFDRRVRGFRGVTDLEDYWSRRPKPWPEPAEPTAQTVIEDASADSGFVQPPNQGLSSHQSLPGQDSRFDPVRALAYSPDGKTLASGSAGAVRLWDLGTGAEALVVRGIGPALAFSPDGGTLASGGDDGTVRLLDPASGSEIRSLSGHSGAVRALAYSPDGRILASGGDDGTVRLWDPDPGSKAKGLRGHSGRVWALAFSPDGNVLASGGNDTTRLWDAHSRSLIRVLDSPEHPIRALAYSSDGRLAIGGANLGLCSLDATEVEIRGDFNHPIRAVACSPDGTRVATSADDGSVALWDAAAGAAVELQILGPPSSLADELPVESASDRYGQEPVGRDFPTITDSVGYDAYAKAIARAIQHKDTQPPLTIGIKGSWGSGKTSLMRMVQSLLEWPDGTHLGDQESRLRPIHLTPAARRLTFLPKQSRDNQANDRVQNRTVLRALRAAPESPDDQPIEADPQSRPDEDPDMAGWRPTVWFNPWMYQTGEQVWAGLAYEITKQITGRMSVAEREHFWLRLNAKRVDEQAVRRKIYGIVLDRLLPYALAALIVFVVGLTLLFTSIPRWIITLLAGGPAPVLAVVAVIQILRVLRTRVRGSVAQLVRPASEAAQSAAESGHGAYEEVVKSPDYASKAGFFYLVRADVQRVLDLVATDQRPVVIFIDDLDRCSPGTVVQVIEAINLFLAGEYPNAIFVAAMEPEMVAAHIQAAYSDLAQALDHSREAEGDGANHLGWKFLEKFVQLPLTLPAMEPDRTRSYFMSLFPGTVADPRDQEPGTIGPADAFVKLQEQIPEGTQLGEAFSMSQALSETDQTAPARVAVAEALREVIDRQLSIDNNEVRKIIGQATPWLAANPREIKRFVNVFRFLVMIDSERGFQNLPSTGDLNAIAKLAVLHIRWPELVAILAKSCPASGDQCVYALLEESDPSVDQEKLSQALEDSGLGWQAKRITAPDLRRFIASDPKIGPVARNYL